MAQQQIWPNGNGMGKLLPLGLRTAILDPIPGLFVAGPELRNML